MHQSILSSSTESPVLIKNVDPNDQNVSLNFGQNSLEYPLNEEIMFRDTTDITISEKDPRSVAQILDPAIKTIGMSNHLYSHQLEYTFPDVTRVLGCINRVLHLSRYVPPNTAPEGQSPINDVIAVIPAYNEELTIGMVVILSLRYVGKVIVVDDGSRDRTSEIAWLSGADVVKLDSNQGKANAIKAGFARAQEIGCSAVVMLDADGQHNPSEIPDLIAPIVSGKADLVIGSRSLKENNDIPSYRRFGQKTLDMATNIGCSYKCSDTQSGFRALSKKAVEMFNFPSEGYNIESDMLEYYSEKGFRITEVPITVRYEVPFKHKKNPFSHGMDVLAHIIGLIGYRRPLLMFGSSGFFLVVIGTIFGFFTFDQYYSSGRIAFMIPMIGGLALILGLLLVTTGLILNSLVKIVKMGG